MRRHHDRITGFDRNQNFENSCGSRISRRNNAGDDTTGTGDFNYVFGLADYANRAQILEIVPNVFRRESVLFLLVGRNAVTGFFYRQGRDPGRFPQRCVGHRRADAIDLCLIKARQFCLGSMRCFDQVAGLLHGNKVFIRRHDNLRNCRLSIADSRF